MSCNVLSWTTGETAAGGLTGCSLGEACIPISETVASIPTKSVWSFLMNQGSMMFAARTVANRIRTAMMKLAIVIEGAFP